MHKDIELEKFLLSIKGDELSDNFIDVIQETALVIEEFLFSSQLSISHDQIDKVECSLSLCNGEEIKLLNKNFRQIDKVTDVLSFPVHENLRLDDELFGLQGNLEIGDIIICTEVAANQAAEFQITFEQEMLHLIIHGVLHLVGFDHEVSEEEEKIMLYHEENLIKSVYKKLGLENG